MRQYLSYAYINYLRPRNDVSTAEEDMKAELEAKERKHLNKRPREESAAIEDDTGNLN